MKIAIILILIFSLQAYAKEIHPTFKLKSMGFVNDFTVNENIIYIANDEGTVDIFDLNTGELIHQIVLDPVVTELGDLQSPNILSVDHLNEKLLILSIGAGPYRNVWIYENFTLKKIIAEDKKLILKEARFVDDEKIILGTFSSEIILYDIGENYNLYKRHVTQSTLGDIALSKDKTKVVMADESGEVRLLDVKTSQTLGVFDTQNVDNIYHVAYAKGVIITAGQDRRVAVYQEGVKDYHIKSDFIVYCVGISPSGKIGVYSSGEESDLQLFDTKTEKKMDKLVGHKGTVNQIKFINEKELFTNERNSYVYYWRLD
ncbi:MAG: nitrate reductase [Helicobacteraceae bacterium]|nr:nitrate reductase [Candidatus Sulfurimonas ponti]MBL6973710.1 nitrate reductase [Sulfurimonas sp.]